METVQISRPALDSGLTDIKASPTDSGTIDLIVCRPAEDQREVISEAELDVAIGLVGDNWKDVPSIRTPDRSAHPDMQLTLMNSRVIALIAGGRDRWKLAGDQIFVDLDLSHTNLPAGTRLQIGSAIIEMTDQPHSGCSKFTQRFGLEAHRWTNSDEGMSLRLRGANAKVIEPGTFRKGDRVTKVPGTIG
jgi:hypothetical protein